MYAYFGGFDGCGPGQVVMEKITCFYYLTESNRAPVKEFIDALDVKSQQKFFFVKSLLEEYGYKLPKPHAKYIGDEIFELRFKGREGAIRALYFFFQGESGHFYKRVY